MEEIDGIDLADLLNRDRVLRILDHMPEEERDRFSETLFRVKDEGIAIQPGVAVYILRQMLRGLEALHNKGFVHSDIKPSNIMVDRLGLLRVIDHGRATRSGEDTGILLGSPVYMAPECHDREPAVVQSDLYSAGLVGLEMLTGEPLVRQTEEIRESQLVLIKSNLTLKLQSLLPDYVLENETLSNVIFGLLQPDPMRRFASVDDVESGVSGLPVIHRQLAQIGKDMEYDRELRDFLSYLVDPTSDRIRRDRFELPHG